MPETQPMTGPEVARAVARIEKGVDAALNRLENMPDWKDIDRQEKRRDAEQAKQDTAITAVENKFTTLMFAIIGTALTAVAGVLRTL